MADSLQLSRRGSGWTSAILAGLGRIWAGRRQGGRPARADLDTWPDYMLKDVGLPASRERSIDWRLLL